MVIAGYITPGTDLESSDVMQRLSIYITALLVIALLLFGCGGSGGTDPIPEPTNSFTVDGDLLQDAAVVLEADAVPVSFNGTAKTNEFTLNGRATTGDSVMLFLRFPGTSTGSFAWQGDKSSPVYARLSVRRVDGQRVDLFPSYDTPSGTTVVQEYRDSIIRGTFSGELRGSGHVVTIRDGIFRARR